jgi:hypothetical protein
VSAPERPYPEAAERFLLLVGAAGMSKARLSEESGVPSKRLTNYENGENAPRDVFKKDTPLIAMAEALRILPSALLAWWAIGDDTLMPDHLTGKISEFRSFPAKVRLARWQMLGWQRPQGKQPKIRAAPPRAVR